MSAWLKWLGTGFGITGAAVLAFNLPFSGWGGGLVLFLVSSVSWTVAGVRMRENSLVLLHVSRTRFPWTQIGLIEVSKEDRNMTDNFEKKACC